MWLALRSSFLVHALPSSLEKVLMKELRTFSQLQDRVQLQFMVNRVPNLGLFGQSPIGLSSFEAVIYLSTDIHMYICTLVCASSQATSSAVTVSTRSAACYVRKESNGSQVCRCILSHALVSSLAVFLIIIHSQPKAVW